MRVLFLALAVLLAISAVPASAQTAPQSGAAASSQTPQIGSAATSAQGPSSGPSITLQLSGGSTEPESLGSALEIVLLMTLLSFAPAIFVTMTCFTRIVIVLSFLKRAMSMQDLPPALVVSGFAMFMTLFIMKPVVSDIYDQAYTPYVDGELGWQEAADLAAGRMNQFMLRQTRPDDIELILGLSKTDRPDTALDTPLQVTIPAFILSEIKTAFQMGFVLFLPFVVIDLVISSILVSMGMFTLPPVVVSTPLKLLLFILVDGWDLVVTSLVGSFSQV